jgi:hypothetical protein
MFTDKDFDRPYIKMPIFTLVDMAHRDNEEIMHDHHEYLRELHMGNDRNYQVERQRRREQYIKPLKEVQ